MKLGLLVLLAVAVLLPSLSEGRTVSRCELKEKLGEAITLPKRLQRFKFKILAIVICEASRRSRLNTGLVKVFGKRKTTTTARPTTVVTTTTSTPQVNEITTGATTQPTTTQPTTTKPTTTQPTTTQPTTTKPTTTQPTTTKPTTTQPTTTKPTTTQPTTTKPMTTEPATPEPTQTTSTSPHSEPNATTLEPNRLELDHMRQKRAAESSSMESNSTEIDESLVELLDEIDEGEVREEDEVMQDDSDEDEESSEEVSEEEVEESEEDWKRKKRDVRRWRPNRRWRPWSLGLYGLFQLSDSYFCDSGYRRTRNRCRTDCRAFTDDDITDDIDCFVKTNYWRKLLMTASPRCFRTWNFFNRCT